MTSTRVAYLLVVVCWLSACGHALHGSGGLPAPRLERIADGVWVHASYAEIPGVGTLLSQGLVVRDREGVVLVDTAWNDRDTEQLLAQTQRETGASARLLVVTHAHADKMGGIGAATHAGLHSFAHALTNVDAPARGLGTVDEAVPLAPGESLSLAGVELFYPGPGHTRDNLVIYYAPERVLFGGCLIRPGSATDLGNTADGDVGGWATAVRAVRDRFPEARIVIPSHGPAGGRELLDHTIALADAANRD